MEANFAHKIWDEQEASLLATSVTPQERSRNDETDTFAKSAEHHAWNVVRAFSRCRLAVEWVH